MARQILIAGVDRSQQVKHSGFNIDQSLGGTADSFKFKIEGYKPKVGQSVKVLDTDLPYPLFAGVIDSVQGRERSEKEFTIYTCECSDFNTEFSQLLVVETYEDTAADLIVRDIMNKYCPGFSQARVEPNAPFIEKIIFDYRRPSECINELAEYVGWSWFLDYHRTVHFFNPFIREDLAPQVITEENDEMFRDLEHRINTVGLRNRVFVRGGSFDSDSFVYEIRSDGVARAWNLPHRPKRLTMVVDKAVGGPTPYQVGVEFLHNEADYSYMVNYHEKHVRTARRRENEPQIPNIPEGSTIQWTYIHDLPVITMIEDVESQQAIQAIQGGTGIYEHVLIDETLETLEAAEAAAEADLREHANPKVRGSYITSYHGFKPGQLLTMFLPDRGIEGVFLIGHVSIEPETHEEWAYTVEYGGRLKTIPDVFRAILSAQQKKRLVDTKILNKFVQYAEVVVVEDEVEFVSLGDIRQVEYSQLRKGTLIQFASVGSLLRQLPPSSNWVGATYQVSEDWGSTWSSAESLPVDTWVSVPYDEDEPGRCMFKVTAAQPVRVHNSKVAFDETLAVTGIVVI